MQTASMIVYKVSVNYTFLMQKVQLQIGGMHCGACATGIQMLVSSMDGVANVFVDYEGKKGEVEFDPSKTTLEAIEKGIAELGYTAAVA